MKTRICYRTVLFRIILLILLLPAFNHICSARAKKDTIEFVNGDRITCEIIKLEKGYLYVKVDYVDGTVAMDWSKIRRIESPQAFVFADKFNKRYTGTVDTASPGETSQEVELVVDGPKGGTVAARDVAEIVRTDTSFWQNLHGGISSGLNYSKQQNRTQYSMSSNALFERTRWSASADYQLSFSGGGDISDVRNDLKLNGTRQLRSPRYFYEGVAEFLQSDQQRLDMRRTLGGGVGRLLRNTNNSFVSVYVGSVWNHERYSPSSTIGISGNSAEALVGTQLNFFRFKTTNFLTNAIVYPSLTDPGRVRLDFNTALKLRVAKDLYWNFGYYYNFDSRPPLNTPRSDYGSTSSLGWTF